MAELQNETVNATTGDICNGKVIIHVHNQQKWLWTEAERVFITVAYPFFSTIGILANLAFLFTIFRVRRMHTIVNLYLGCLAFVDIVMLVSADVWHGLTYAHSDIKYNYPFRHDASCWAMFFSVYFGVSASLILITMVSIDRFRAICYPLQHAASVKSNASKHIIGAILFSVLCGIGGTAWRGKLNVMCLVWNDRSGLIQEPISIYRACSPVIEQADIISQGILSVMYFSTLFIDVTMYAKIIWALSQRKSHNDAADHTMKSVRNQVARLLIITGTIVFLTYFPNRLMIIFHLMKKYFGVVILTPEQSQVLLTLTRTVVLLNSTCNPFVYAFSSSFYRGAVYEAFRGRKRSTAAMLRRQPAGRQEHQLPKSISASSSSANTRPGPRK